MEMILYLLLGSLCCWMGESCPASSAAGSSVPGAAWCGCPANSTGQVASKQELSRQVQYVQCLASLKCRVSLLLLSVMISSSKNLCCRYLLQSLFIWLWHVGIQFIIAYISCFGKSSTFVLQWQQQQVSHKLLMWIRLRCRAEILGKIKCIFAPLTIGICAV